MLRDAPYRALLSMRPLTAEAAEGGLNFGIAGKLAPLSLGETFQDICQMSWINFFRLLLVRGFHC